MAPHEAAAKIAALEVRSRLAEASADRAWRKCIKMGAALEVARTAMRNQGWHIAAPNEDVSDETATMVLEAYDAVDAVLNEQRSGSGGAARHAPAPGPESAQAERGASDSDWDFVFPREILGERTRMMTSSDRDNAMKAADAVFNFRWATTRDGHRFWSDVYFRLLRIAEEGR